MSLSASGNEWVPLQLLVAGQAGQISDVLGQPEEVQRLRELGFRNGADVQMLTPGLPCVVKLGEQRLCLRCQDGVCVLVSPRSPRN